MKRLLDIIIAIALLPFILLVIILLSLLILIFDHFSPFYCQKRIGRKRVEFTCFKLQALRPTKNENYINNKEKDKIRITTFGKWMKNRGLDELPQIFNILLGRMSFVGPRPLLAKNIMRVKEMNPEIIIKVEDWERKRSYVRPGLSGWHQIHTPGPQIIKYDLEYLESPSFNKHLKIFFNSIVILIIGKERFFSSRKELAQR